MESKALESDSEGVHVLVDPIAELSNMENQGHANRDQQEMSYFGKTQQLRVCYLRPFQLHAFSTFNYIGLETALIMIESWPVVCNMTDSL